MTWRNGNGLGSDRVRVLHVLGVMNRAGAETRTVEFIRTLRGTRFLLDVCTLSGRSGAYDEEIRALGGRVLQCPLAPKPTFPLRWAALLQREKYDVVHSHVHYFSGLLLAVARLVCVPRRVAHIRNTSDGRRTTWPRRGYRSIMRALIDRNATRVIGVSASTLQALWGPAWKSDGRKRVIYDGIEQAPFRVPLDAAEVRAELGIPARADVVVHVGRFHPSKNHAALLPMLRALALRRPSVVMLLVGDGELRAATETAFIEQGLMDRVRFLGVRADVPRILRASNVLVLPSLWEGLGDVMLEALASGIPVVASPIPPVLEIARRTVGIRTAEPSDAEGFARAVDESLSFCGGGRLQITLPPEFTAEVAAQRVLECYAA